MKTIPLVIFVSVLTTITVVMIRDLGKLNPAYVVDWGLVITGFLYTSIMFLLGFFAREKN